MARIMNQLTDDTFLGVLTRDRRYSLGDLPIIAAAIKEVDVL